MASLETQTENRIVGYTLTLTPKEAKALWNVLNDDSDVIMSQLRLENPPVYDILYPLDKAVRGNA